MIEIDNRNIIYFDNNATTPTDPLVVEAMMPYFNSDFGNPSSHHFFGEKAKKAVEHSRSLIADILNAKQQEIIFTSGATESINLAIKGIAKTYSFKGKHIITTQTEHSAVLDVCKCLERKGFEIEFISVDKYGLINIAELEDKIREDTILVSVIFVNNETGVIQPIKEIGEICKSKDIRFLTDATQAVGKIPVSVNELNVDLLCFSGHKFYGPKGIGGTYCRNGVKLEALIHGGGHESGLRSGTLNVPGIVGLAKAFELAVDEMQLNIKNIKAFRDEFENKLLNTGKVMLNGHTLKRLYNVSNLCFIEMDPILLNNELKNIAYAQNSACNSSSIKPSHVLKAMGLSDKKALASFRFSFGKYNTSEEINRIIATLNEIFEAKTVLNKV